MNFKTTLLLLLLFCAYLGKAQEADTVKYWSKSNKLRGFDFQGQIPSTELTSSKMAVCPHEIVVLPFRVKGVLSYRVELVFLKKQAWAKDTLLYTLAHEQLHFDIAELYARKLRKLISEVRAKNGASGDFKVVIEDLLAQEAKAQADFDRETAHGIYQTNQLKLTKKIAEGLESFKEYASDNESCPVN